MFPRNIFALFFVALLVVTIAQAFNAKPFSVIRTSTRVLAGVPASPPKERGPPKKKPKDDVIQVVVEISFYSFIV